MRKTISSIVAPARGHLDLLKESLLPWPLLAAKTPQTSLIYVSIHVLNRLFVLPSSSIRMEVEVSCEE